jgi:hypothetical protein
MRFESKTYLNYLRRRQEAEISALEILDMPVSGS